MSKAYIRDLHDINDDIVFPSTSVEAVYMPDNKTKLMDEIQSLRDGTSTTVFNSDGTITKTLYDNKVVTTTFNADGSISDVCKYPDGTEYYTKQTVFNSDGSIEVTMTFADMEGAEDNG